MIEYQYFLSPPPPLPKLGWCKLQLRVIMSAEKLKTFLDDLHFSVDNSYKWNTQTHTDISLYIYRFMYRYSELLYKTCTDGLYFCVHNSYKWDTQTHTDISLYIYRFLYRYTVLLYTSCTDGLYFCVYCCTTWHYLKIHLWCTHYAWISCTTVRLYCSPVSVPMYWFWPMRAPCI